MYIGPAGLYDRATDPFLFGNSLQNIGPVIFILRNKNECE